MVTSGSRNAKLDSCPALAAIKVISGKWKTRILWLLRERHYHFGELRRVLPGVSAKILSQQLKQLDTDGLICVWEEVREGIAHSVYGYSEYGRRLIPVLDALGEWGLEHQTRRVSGTA